MDTYTLWLILAIVVLIFFSAFFSGSETALTATSRARLLQIGKDGEWRAMVVRALIERRERLIGAILLGNNLVNILASALATSLFISLFGDSGVIYATLLMTAMVVMFAEVMPKTYALSNPDQLSMRVAPILRPIVKVFGPIVIAIEWVVKRTLKMIGFDTDNIENILSANDELRGTISLHHEEGSVVKDDRDMLGGILDLQDLTVDEVMVHRKNMMMIDAGQSNAQIIKEVLDSPYTRIPLWQEDPENIIGILHSKDLLRVLHDPHVNVSQIDLNNILISPWFVPETTTLREQLNAFLQKRQHFALVVDEYGALMGLVTLEDILEEIVGEISDEHDESIVGIRPQPNGSVNVDGAVTIRDLNRFMDWDLPDDEANTIAGLVIHEAQAIPTPGQIFSYYGYRFEIMRRQRNQITALRITESLLTKRSG